MAPYRTLPLTQPARLVPSAAVLCLCGILLLVGCGSGSQSVGSATSILPSVTTHSNIGTTGATAATATSPTVTTLPIPDQDAKAVRDLAFLYWDAYNSYEPDRAISYLDEAYRPAQEAVVRDEVRRIRTFHVTLGMSEKTPPALTGTDQAEMYLTMKEPVGTRTILMKFGRRAGAWTITFVQEVK